MTVSTGKYYTQTDASSFGIFPNDHLMLGDRLSNSSDRWLRFHCILVNAHPDFDAVNIRLVQNFMKPRLVGNGETSSL